MLRLACGHRLRIPVSSLNGQLEVKSGIMHVPRDAEVELIRVTSMLT